VVKSHAIQLYLGILSFSFFLVVPLKKRLGMKRLPPLKINQGITNSQKIRKEMVPIKENH